MALLIALGLFGAVGPMLVLSTMLVAMLTVHIKQGFFATNNGIELPFTYAVVAVALALAGYGAYALDALLGITVTSQPAAVGILLALGVLGALGNLLVRRAPAPQQAPNHLAAYRPGTKQKKGQGVLARLFRLKRSCSSRLGAASQPFSMSKPLAAGSVPCTRPSSTTALLRSVCACSSRPCADWRDRAGAARLRTSSRHPAA